MDNALPQRRGPRPPRHRGGVRVWVWVGVGGGWCVDGGGDAVSVSAKGAV